MMPGASGGPVLQPSARGRRVIALLAPNIRLVDDGRQWIVEVRKGRATGKSTGWRACGYARSRGGVFKLLARFGHWPDPALVTAVATLPETYALGCTV